MKRYAALIILILFLGIGLGIYMIFRQEGQPAEAASVAQTPAAMSGTPTPRATPTATPTATPLPTMPPTPSPTPSPLPTPVPTATPVPTPTPYIEMESSGSFRTDTGTYLNLVVDYSVKREGEKATLTLYAYTESYSLFTEARHDDLRFVIDGVTTYATAGAITVEADEGLTKTLIGKVEADVAPESSVRVDVTWEFLGVIGGKSIDRLTASTTLDIP
ncbi:MAG: hypothetical protein IKQ69_08360 [Oscillospiraceae bacterium]|nr:hypothetical protein [Oscillospiraceae bacterium]